MMQPSFSDLFMSCKVNFFMKTNQLCRFQCVYLEWDRIKWDQIKYRWNRVQWTWPGKIMGWGWDKRVLEYSLFQGFLYLGKEMIGSVTVRSAKGVT